MKREILFRGKRTDNGEWVEGLLFYSHGLGVYKITKSNGWIPSYSNPDEGESTEYIDIISDTVCQFTGITDKNGIKVFEGDIAKYYNPYSKQWYIQIVMWDKMFASFGFFTEDSEWCKENDWLKIESIEVIGNIHDNKDLLK